MVTRSCASLHTGMAACAARGISVIIGAPFASGILATGPGGQPQRFGPKTETRPPS